MASYNRCYKQNKATSESSDSYSSDSEIEQVVDDVSEGTNSNNEEEVLPSQQNIFSVIANAMDTKENENQEIPKYLFFAIFMMMYMIKFKLSVIAMDALLGMLPTFFSLQSFYQNIHSVHRLKTIICRDLVNFRDLFHKEYYCNHCETYIDSVICTICKFKNSSTVVLFDVAKQVEYILSTYFIYIKSYADELKVENGDVLSGMHYPDILVDNDNIHIYLNLSTDGGNPYRKKKIHMWPL